MAKEMILEKDIGGRCYCDLRVCSKKRSCKKATLCCKIVTTSFLICTAPSLAGTYTGVYDESLEQGIFGLAESESTGANNG